ncbi:MAG: hypothetical protein JEY94_02500 [Melioribacteraceae bacterium]|nr:hypothetical protein [Melioribacteraceae bacterium]
MRKIFSIIGILYIVVYVTLMVLFNNEVITLHFFLASIYAGVLNLINSSIAFFSFEFSSEKSNQKFLLLNLGNMVVRMMLILITIVLLIVFIKVDMVGFLLIFFSIYFILLALEVYYFNLKVKIRTKKE